MDEIRVMKRVSDSESPHVLQMIACVTNTLPPMILLEFVPHGNLKDYLRKLRAVTNVRSSCGVVGDLAYYCFQTSVSKEHKRTLARRLLQWNAWM